MMRHLSNTKSNFSESFTTPLNVNNHVLLGFQGRLKSVFQLLTTFIFMDWLPRRPMVRLLLTFCLSSRIKPSNGLSYNLYEDNKIMTVVSQLGKTSSTYGQFCATSCSQSAILIVVADHHSSDKACKLTCTGCLCDIGMLAILL